MRGYLCHTYAHAACQRAQSCDYSSILRLCANTDTALRPRSEVIVRTRFSRMRRGGGGGEKGGTKMMKQNEYNVELIDDG